VRIWTAPSRAVIGFVIHTHAAQGGMGWFEAVQGNHTRIAMPQALASQGMKGNGEFIPQTLR